MHTVLNMPGGGQTLAEVSAAREGAFVKPGIGINGDGTTLEVVDMYRSHNRFQQWQKPLNTHFRFFLQFDRNEGLYLNPNFAATMTFQDDLDRKSVV